MQATASFFVSGWEHIIDPNAFDHLLFVTTLCAAYRLTQWRQILVIVTAFTIGHSCTLILSSLDLIPPTVHSWTSDSNDNYGHSVNQHHQY